MADIVIVEDEPVLARSIVTYLERRGYVAEFALDIRGAQVVMMTGHGDIDTAVKAMKAGARDFLVKPVPLATLAGLARDLRIDEMAPWADPVGLDRIIGRSGETAQVKAALKRLADQARALGGAAPGVMIAGAAGTGKMTAARALAEAALLDLPGSIVEFDCRSDGIDRLRDSLAEAAVLILRRVDHLPGPAQAVLAGLLDRHDMPWTIAPTTAGLSPQAMVQTGRCGTRETLPGPCAEGKCL